MPVSQIVEGGLDNVLTSSTQMLKQLKLMQQQFARDFATKINSLGWEVMNLPAKQLMVILRPRISVTDNTLYAFQMQTMSWSVLRDIPITTITQRLSEIFGGTEDGRVIRLFNGHSDAKKYDGSNAQHIRAKVTPAFNYLGSPDVLKQALMVRPTFLSGGDLSYVVRMNTDFAIPAEFIAPIEVDPIVRSGTAPCGTRTIGPRPFVSNYEWRQVEGLGFSMTPTVYASSRSRTVLAAIEYMFRAGGPYDPDHDPMIVHAYFHEQLGLHWSDDIRGVLYVPDEYLGQIAEPSHVVVAVAYNDFIGKTCCLHSVIRGPDKVTRKMVRETFAYPFDVCHCEAVLALVDSARRSRDELDQKLGFGKCTGWGTDGYRGAADAQARVSLAQSHAALRISSWAKNQDLPARLHSGRRENRSVERSSDKRPNLANRPQQVDPWGRVRGIPKRRLTLLRAARSRSGRSALN